MRATASDELTMLVIDGRWRNFQAIDCVRSLRHCQNVSTADIIGADTARRREGVLIPIHTTYVWRLPAHTNGSAAVRGFDGRLSSWLMREAGAPEALLSPPLCVMQPGLNNDT